MKKSSNRRQKSASKIKQPDEMLLGPLASRLIRRHEGVRHTPYKDSLGKLTIGVGRNLSDRGLSVDEVNYLYASDYQLACSILDIWAEGWTKWPLGPRLALLSMAYNMGAPRLSSFVKMRTALQKQDFETAATEALDSKWAGQVGRRACETARLLRGDLSVLHEDCPTQPDPEPSPSEK